MANITVGQIIMDAQRMASRVKDLDALSSALLVEAEGNNRFVESLRQFQDDIDSLNRISNNKSNAEMVNRIQQQNANSSEILKENRELKVCIEDYERAMEIIMQKYREHTNSKVLDSKLNFKEVYNEKLWKIIREQREKINEMAAVMQRVAALDDDCDLEQMSRLRLENKTLRELLQISKQFGSASRPILFNEHLLEEKAVQTEVAEDSADELSLSAASVENINNNSVIQLNAGISVSTGQPMAAAHVASVDSVQKSQTIAAGENNNEIVVGATPVSALYTASAEGTKKSNLSVGGAATAMATATATATALPTPTAMAAATIASAEAAKIITATTT